MSRSRRLGLVLVVVAVFIAACGPAAGPSQSAAPPAADKQAPAAAPAAPPPKPAVQPAKPAAQPAKPAVQPAAPPSASAAGKTRIIYGSTQAGSSYYVHSVALSKLWNSKVPEVEVTNSEGSCLETLRRMDRGDFQAGVACPDLTYRAWHGLEEFKDKPVQSQRLLYGYITAPTTIQVRADSGITKVEELAGKDFSGGIKGSSHERQVINILNVLGIKPKWYAGGIQEILQAYKDRRIVGFGKTQGGPKNIDGATLEAHTAAALRMLSLTPEQEQKVLREFPYYGFMSVKANDLGNGLPDKDIRAVALPVGVALHKDIPADLGYKLAKVAIEDQTEQATAFPAVKGIDFAQLTLEIATTPLHAGTVKYLRERGLQIKTELIPPEAK